MYLKTSMYQLSFDGHKFPFTGSASTVFPICDHQIKYLFREIFKCNIAVYVSFIYSIETI
jgi:hypothetical protein